MKILILSLALLFLLPGLEASKPSKRGKAKVKLSEVNIYEGSDTKAKVCGSGKKDEELEFEVEEPVNGFYKVKYKGKDAYVMASQVDCHDDDVKEIAEKKNRRLYGGQESKKPEPTRAPTKAPDKKEKGREKEKPEGPSKPGMAMITAAGCKIYSGNSTNSKLMGVAEEGEELEFLKEMPSTGYYKVRYHGKVCFVASSCLQVHEEDLADLKEKEKEQHTKPTQAPTAAPTRVPTLEPTDIPTGIPTRMATRIPTALPTEEPTEIPTAIPTRMPTRIPTALPTEEPTEIPTRAATKEPTPQRVEEPTKAPTPRAGEEATPLIQHVAPTKVPTPEPVEEPTAIPTRVPTNAPTAVPTEVPTEIPTAVPTRVPTRAVIVEPTEIPTAVPTRVPPTPVPTAVPTRIRELEVIQRVLTMVPTFMATPVPTPGPRVGRGRRVATPVPTPVRQVRQQRRVYQQNTRNTGGNAGSRVQFSGGSGAGRSAWDMPGFSIAIPISFGPCVPVKPAFKPEATDQDCRCIDSASGAGIGLEWRVFSFWRLFGDVTGYSHTTLALRKDTTGQAVNVPGLGAVMINDSDVQYAMDTTGWRIGTKFSVPLPYIEPWAGIGMGKYNWRAVYRSKDKAFEYGEDKGLAFSMTYLGGIDFKINAGPGFFVLTPFYEFGAPYIFPKVANIADFNKDWKDDFGTPTMIPHRFGISLGYGW